jgi:hypothetical protein
MANLHDLATTIGTSSLLSILSALAAGLAVITLLNGAATVRKSKLPSGFPGDPEAQLDKYVLPFSQLDQVGQDNAENLLTVAEQLKNQPAAYLGLTAFQIFVANKQAEATGVKSKPVKAAQKDSKSAPSEPAKPAKPAKPGKSKTAPSQAARSQPAPTGASKEAGSGAVDQDDDEDDFPQTVDLSLPKKTDEGRNRK